MLDIPLLRRVERTPYGYELDKSLPMTYDSSRQALHELGRDARFEDDIGHYNYRRWTANEVNRTFLPVERNLAENTSAMDDGILLLLFLTCCPQGTLRVRSGKGYLASPAMRFLKSTTNQSLSGAIFSMLSFSDRLRKVSSGSLEACSGKGISQPHPILPTGSDVPFAKSPQS